MVAVEAAEGVEAIVGAEVVELSVAAKRRSGRRRRNNSSSKGDYNSNKSSSSPSAWGSAVLVFSMLCFSLCCF